MPLSTLQKAAETWTDEELEGQLQLVFWEHKSIPDDRRTYRDPMYRSCMDAYSAVCDEYRRRGKQAELDAKVKEYKESNRKKS